MLDDPVVLLRDVGPENGRSNFRVIVLGDDLTDVMEQCDEYRLVVGAVFVCASGRLQGVLEAVTGPPSSDSSICFSIAIMEL